MATHEWLKRLRPISKQRSVMKFAFHCCLSHNLCCYNEYWLFKLPSDPVFFYFLLFTIYALSYSILWLSNRKYSGILCFHISHIIASFMLRDSALSALPVSFLHVLQSYRALYIECLATEFIMSFFIPVCRVII